jgi:L-cysteine/cystine lyase
VVSPFLPDDEKLVAVRAALPALEAGIYLNTGTAGPIPRETAAAMAEVGARELTAGRAHPADHPDLVARMDEARATVAAVLSADLEAIALTHSTTDAMNLAAWGIDWRAGDRLVTTNLEHMGGLAPLLAVRDRFELELVLADLGDGGDDARTLAALDAAIAPGTRLVAISHVAWSTGAVLPLRAIADLAHARGALLLVDGAQAVGAIPVDPAALAADAYAVSAQKWLLGPDGMGALWVGPAALERVRTSFAGLWGFAAHDPARAIATPFPDARRLQSSNWHRPSVTGMARSVGWLSMYVGLDFVHGRGAALARSAAGMLAAVPGVELVTPIDRMATLVTFRIAGWPAEAAVEELGSRAFAIVRAIPTLDAVRISVGFFNTEGELGRFVETVRELAGHTPETLPPRRLLTILGQEA